MSESAHWPATYSSTQAQLGTTLAPYRLFRFAGAPPVAALCGSGQDADGVTGPDYWDGITAGLHPKLGTYAVPGRPVKVTSGGAYAAGANLQSDATGRAITHASGPVVLRALEAATAADQVRWAVFTSGR